MNVELCSSHLIFSVSSWNFAGIYLSTIWKIVIIWEWVKIRLRTYNFFIASFAWLKPKLRYVKELDTIILNLVLKRLRYSVRDRKNYKNTCMFLDIVVNYSLMVIFNFTCNWLKSDELKVFVYWYSLSKK